MWLKGLVAVTCLAVLAAIGFYFWRENQDRDAGAASEAALRSAAIATECKTMLDDLAGGRSGTLTVAHMLVCIRAGAFTTDDMRERGLSAAAASVDQHIEQFGLD